MRNLATIREEFERIKKSTIDNSTKIALLEGIAAGLREEVERK